ncbi:MAG: hypothetical protein EPO27_09895 [Betaproteobacteria bacterium]|nr:MAG: hypothetical protein EPO27_09895 [Betaproteobacteria bacterium]
MRFASVVLALFCASALAQDAEIQRELIRRDQQTDAFKLQLQQSQERVNAPPGDSRGKQALEARQLGERQRLEAAGERQIQDVGRDTPAELRPQERDRMQQERRPLAEPSQPPVSVTPDPPRPLPMQ